MTVRHPQVQCASLCADDFNETGSVIVTTRLASGFEVTKLNPRASYAIKPCPTFPKGRICIGIAIVRSTLKGE